MKLNIIFVFLIVTGCSLVGMVLAGLFGFAAAHMAPDLFSTLIPWGKIEPVGTATVTGAAVGVLLGGGIGVFAVVVQFVSQLLARGRKKVDDGPRR